MCKNSLLSSDSLPLQRLFISGLHCKGRHNMDKIFGMESMDCGMEKNKEALSGLPYIECAVCVCMTGCWRIIPCCPTVR